MKNLWKWMALLTVPVLGNTFAQVPEKALPDNNAEVRWVDSLYESLSTEEKLGQLFMIRVHSNRGPEHEAAVTEQVKNYHVGGLTFFQGTADGHARLINLYQQQTSVPLMVSIDGEWGLGMRLPETTISFPKQLQLGAIQDNNLLYKMGREVARHCRRLGIHVNFAPVVDVNNNPENPVINMRSFGEDRYNVAAKGFAYMDGLQDGQVMACAKHFPGHGDTDKDSHLELPLISHNLNRLDSIEFFPFKMLIENGLQSVMVAHLSIPALDSAKNIPTTVSHRTVTGLLRKEMNFNGLVITDALEMKGLSDYYGPGEAAAAALIAGNDILLLPDDIPAALKAIKLAIEKGDLSWDAIQDKVKRILKAKYRLGLTHRQVVRQDNLQAELNNPEALALKRELIEASLTLVRDNQNLVPLHLHENSKYASISLGHDRETAFQKRLQQFLPHTALYAGKTISSRKKSQLLTEIDNKDVILISLHNMSEYASKNFGLSQSVIDFINEVQEKKSVILVVFGNPYSLKHFDKLKTVLVAYQEEPDSEDLAAQALWGAIGISGRLPVTASPLSTFGKGISRKASFKLGFEVPERVGLNSSLLGTVDTLLQEAMDEKATPGAVVLVAKDGKVVFHKAYGYHTYEKITPVQVSDIYDLASITKVASATLAIMHLHENKKINLFEPISTYLPELDTTDKSNLFLYDILAHHAGLVPWLPFYEKTVEQHKRYVEPKPGIYRRKRQGLFNIPITASLYMRNDYIDTIWQEIRETPLREDKAYKYSDLGFYLIAQTVERVTGKTLDAYVEDNFYKPMGLQNIAYQPWKRFDLNRIPPSESDNYFRSQEVKGYVHDMGAAMLGGVSGHAGLFSNAYDLAVIFQMLLNGGYYGGKQYLQPETITLFTTRHQADSRRGLGFDMKQLDTDEVENMSTEASKFTFGHLGFTGTCVWADPQHNLIYILLTNRTWPSMKNYKWGKNDYRPRIQTAIYKALNTIE